MLQRMFILAVALLLGSCTIRQAEVRTPAFDEQLPVAQPNYSDGSIWQNSSTNLAGDLKARGRGDILTILIVESASASKEANTDTSRDNSMKASMPNLLGLETTSFKTWMDLNNMIKASYNSEFKGKGATSRTDNLNATISAKVVDVLPNGNFLIEGRRNVTVNSEEQIIKVEGTVRPLDIRRDNIIYSNMVADARITYVGNGIISDQQRPGWLATLLAKVWPF